MNEATLIPLERKERRALFEAVAITETRSRERDGSSDIAPEEARRIVSFDAGGAKIEETDRTEIILDHVFEHLRRFAMTGEYAATTTLRKIYRARKTTARVGVKS